MPKSRNRVRGFLAPLICGPGLLAVLLGLAAPVTLVAAGGKLEFNRDIRPILSENCFSCHGPDKNQRKAKLRLDVREVALEKKAFAPGRPEASELIRRISTDKADDLMPPPDSHRQLSAPQKELLRRWVAEGADYQPHWSYLQLARPTVPVPADQSWGKNPVDAFVLHDLAARQIKPVAEADRRTLLRRLSLDLIGLPPTPAEMAAFLADATPQAYERQVDRLLASPHYGERMAVPWLDLVRFSDTVGYHGDQNINVFPYRDYVIDAFNHNLPFDQFTIEQLAGDLLPHPTTEQIVATGFNRLNMVTREGGAQPREYLAKYAADRVRTVATVWLGSTMGCCECHDHKYDPFSTRDFYSLAAFFADIRQWGVYNDYAYTPNPDLKGWSNDHPFPPEIVVESPYLRQRQARIAGRFVERARAVAGQWPDAGGARSAFADWRHAGAEVVRQQPDGWLTPGPQVTFPAKAGATNSPSPVASVVGPDGSIQFPGKSTAGAEVVIPLPAGWVAALRLELLPTPEHDGRILPAGMESTTITLSATLQRGNAARGEALTFAAAEADQKEERFANGYAMLGLKGGWTTARAGVRTRQTAVWLLEKPTQVGVGDTLTVRLGKGTPGCVRISITPFAALDPMRAGAGALAPLLTDVATEPSGELLATYLLSTGADPAVFAEFRRWQRDWLDCRGAKSPTVVTVAGKPAETRVLPRGNWQDESGPIVLPATPQFLPPVANPEGRRLTRLDLARWLVSPENPLPARAAMNRLWKQFFGTGLSAVVDDLGAQGEWPVHPELLDWLAVEFRDSGWDFKHVVKLIVQSATYREASRPSPELHELDPANRLLAAQSPRRLEAEFIRDNALAIAGLLNEDLGGPSAHPYQPSGYYANIQFPNRDYEAETDDRQYRRGLYAHWQRTFLNPSLANFDAPSREECTATRNISNSPQQALTLLNDPVFVEAARALAVRLLQEGDRETDGQRIDRAFLRALGRPAGTRERDSLGGLLARQREYYSAHPEDAAKLQHIGATPAPAVLTPPELAAWTQVCRVVLDLHETITRY